MNQHPGPGALNPAPMAPEPRRPSGLEPAGDCREPAAPCVVEQVSQHERLPRPRGGDLQRLAHAPALTIIQKPSRHLAPGPPNQPLPELAELAFVGGLL